MSNNLYFGAVQPPGGSSGPNLQVSPSSGSVVDGVATLAITATLSGSVATLSAAVAGGGTISTNTPVSGTSFVYTPPATGMGTAIVTVTDVVDSLSAQCTITYRATAPAMTPAVIVSSTITPASVAFTFSGVGGGVAPYSTRLYRSPVAGFTPPSGVAVGSPVAGTSGTLVDPSPVADVVSFYAALSSDSNGDSVASNQLPGSPQQPALVIGFIGDSITQGIGAGVGGDAPTLTGKELAVGWGYRSVAVCNQGGAGTTSANWTPGNVSFTASLAAFAAAGCTVIHVMLGTNDCSSSGGISGAAYQSNMVSIVNGLVAAGYKVVVSWPPYVDIANGTYAQWDAGSLNAMLSYQPIIAAMVDNVHVFLGDTQAWSYFADNRNLLPDGVHPGTVGYPYLAQLWAQAIATALKL